MSIRGRWALLGLGVVLLVAGACANNDNNSGGDEPSAEPTASVVGATTDIDQRDDATPASGAAGGGAAGGSTLNCGEEVQMHGTGYDRAARECLWQAYSAGGGAVFTTTMTTIEGDPIVWHINTSTSDRIEVTIDNTQDKFAAPENRVVKTATCTDMAITDDGQNDYAFELSGCDVEGGILVV